MEEPRLKPFIVLKSDPRWDACIAELRRLVDFAKSASVGLDSEFWECPGLRGGSRRQGARSSGTITSTLVVPAAMLASGPPVGARVVVGLRALFRPAKLR